MKESDRQHIEKRLLQERDRVLRALQRLEQVSEDDGELTQYRQHMADEGTDTMEQEKSLMLLGRDGALLTRIDRTLRRLYKEPDSFGLCEECGRVIDFERLDLIPWARLCIEHKTLEELT